ncbi:unnamed protein product [Coregonus sp. 'balchen']|nr:unnamed protein product [Coregonus sp. 'balchen']
MPTTENSTNETQNQASPANSGSGTANISDTIVQVGASVKAPIPSVSSPAIPATISKGTTKDPEPGQTQPQNANNGSTSRVRDACCTYYLHRDGRTCPGKRSTSYLIHKLSREQPGSKGGHDNHGTETHFSGGGGTESELSNGDHERTTTGAHELSFGTSRDSSCHRDPGTGEGCSDSHTKTNNFSATSCIRQTPTDHVCMVLIRSDSGQLMLVSQQALAAAQGLAARTPGTGTSPSSRPPATQTQLLCHLKVSAATVVRKAENPGVIRVPPPPNPHVTTAQRTPLVKVVGAVLTPPAGQSQTPRPMIRPVAPVTVTRSPGPGPLIIPTKPTNTPRATPPSITPEVLENVKKCKNFLDGRLEPEEFTDQLYRELKSSPQPYLVPFLKKSLPAVRQLTPNPQLFIQEVDQPKPQAPAASKAPAPTPGRTPTLLSTNARPAHLSAASGQPIKSTQLVIQQPRGVVYKPAVTTSAPARTYLSVQNRSLAKPMVLQSGQHYNTGAIVRRTPFLVPPPPAQRHPFKDSVGSFREEDDINDVASMAGVNVSEENARILATNSGLVGSVERSCQDEPFLSPAPLLTHILHTGEKFGVSEVGSDVISLVSHATQERLRDLLEKVTVVAQHRKMALKEDYSHVQTSNVRSQLHFLEELERLEKQRRDDEERETLLRIARSRCNTEDPDQQLLKQRAKEHREANLTALAAIGPRRKRPLDSNGIQVGPGGIMSVLQRAGVQRVTGVSLRDLLFCLEQDPPLRHSLTLYKGLLR